MSVSDVDTELVSIHSDDKSLSIIQTPDPK